MLISAERQDEVKAAILEAFPNHPNIEAELHENPHDAPAFAPLAALRAGLTRPQPIRQVCDKSFRAVHHSGPRGLGAITGVCIHCTQGDSAIGAAMWFANNASGGSAQRCVDNKTCYRTLPDDLIPWAAPGFNLFGIHLEFAGRVEWSHQTWLDHDMELRRGAYKTALDCKRYRIPHRERITISELKNGKNRGITDHFAVSQAFHLSTHSDPRPNFPWHLFMEYVDFYFDKL